MKKLSMLALVVLSLTLIVPATAAQQNGSASRTQVAAGMKMRNQALEEVVMTDVCPYTLGIATAREDEHGRITDGHFSPIIERNATVPVSRSEQFCAMHDGQRQIKLEIFQGESPRTEHNVALGKLTVPLRPDLAKDRNGVDVRFTYDVNGVLQVEARVQSTGVVHELIIQGNDGVLDEREIRERLARLQSLKIHPREDQVQQHDRWRLLAAEAERLGAAVGHRYLEPEGAEAVPQGLAEIRIVVDQEHARGRGHGSSSARSNACAVRRRSSPGSKGLSMNSSAPRARHASRSGRFGDPVSTITSAAGAACRISGSASNRVKAGSSCGG